MTPEQWNLARELFDQLRTEDPAGRVRILDRACAGDPGLRLEIEELLAFHDTQGPLDSTVTVDRVPKPDREFEIGQVVGNRFRILAFIGHGGMGSVYRAEDLELHTQVALKVLRRAISSNEGMIARFRREVLVARRVTHPNVCRMHDFSRHDETGGGTLYFLTMELIDGENLGERLARKSCLTPAAALPVIRQVGAGLAAAHDAGVVHRDLKPGNIMLTGEGSASRIITDFGLAYTAAEGGHSLAAIGTPAYMAPEQFEGQPATPRSDLYSLGVVMYQMLSGHLPAREASRPSGDYPPDMPPHWARVIEQCLSRDPGKRPASAQEFLDALDNPAPVPRPRSVLWQKLGYAIGGVAVAAALVFVAWWQPWRRPPERNGEAQRWVQKAVSSLNDGAYTTAVGLLTRAVQAEPDSPVAHARLAEAYTELELPDKAREEILEALTKAPDRSSLDPADRLMVEAVQLTVNNQPQKALDKYRQLASLDGGSSTAVALGRAYERAGDRPHAAKAYEAAIAKDSQNPAAILRLAELHVRGQEYDRARPELDRAAGIYQVTGNMEGVVETVYQDGLLLTAAGKLSEAKERLEHCVSLAETTKDAPHQIRCLQQLGVVSRSLGDSKGAAAYARRAIEKAEETGNQALAEFGLLDLGNIHLARLEYAEAENYFKTALAWADREKMPRVRARAQLSLASLKSQQEKYQEVLDYARPAGEWFEQNGFAKPSRQAQVIIAAAYEGLGQLTQALPLLDKVLVEAASANDTRLALDAAPRRADILADLDRYSEALAGYQESVQLAESTQNRLSQALQTVNAADMLWRLGRFPEAEAALDRASKWASDPELPGNHIRDRVDNARSSVMLAKLQPDLALRAVRGALRSSDDEIKIRARCLAAMAKAQHGDPGPITQCLAGLPPKGDQRLHSDVELAGVQGLLASRQCAEAVAQVEKLLPTINSLAQPESELRLLSMGRIAAEAAHRPDLATAWSTRERDLQPQVRKMFGEAGWPLYIKRPDVVRFTNLALSESDGK